MAGWRTVAAFGALDPTPTVRENLETGALVCECPTFVNAGRLMCPHVEAVYMDNLDGRMDTGERRSLNSRVEVVLFRFPPAGAVVFVGPKDDQGDREAWLVISDDERFTEFLGFVRDGDGRRLLRQMILDYLSAKLLDGVSCESPHHYKGGGSTTFGPVDFLEAAEKTCDDADPKRPENLARVWSIVRCGTCIECAELAIPEAPTAPPWRP